MVSMKMYGEPGRELTLRETQLASLEILRQVDSICRREGLTYWLMFGSLIGAVRHGGFIPWDDDLDIAMPRPDYDRLVRHFALHEEELRPLVAVNPELGLNRPFLITRISDTRYKQVGEYGDIVDELGAFVDVYPLDGLGPDMEGALAHKARAHKLVLSYLRANNFDYYNSGAGAAKRMAKKVLSAALGSPGKYQERLFGLCGAFAYGESRYVTNLCWTATPDKSIYERSWFEVTKPMPFEDMAVPVPAGYDELLRVDYGDYMQLPPENERVGHHYYSIVWRP